MPREYAVRTPESVEITHSLAGIGSRCLAAAIDHTIQVSLFVGVILGADYLAEGLKGLEEGLNSDAAPDGWAIALTLGLLFLVIWGYFVFFETLWNGQTPGKRLFRLRVVRDDGRPIDFFTAATRNIVRLIDLIPSFYVVGVITMFFSPAYKRVGDYAAGTVVVKEYRDPPARKRRARRPHRSEATEPVASEAATGLDAAWIEEVPGVSIAGIGRVARDEYDAARRFMDRREDLPREVAGDLARRIASPILERLDMVPDDPDRYPYETFLETLARDFVRWQDVRYS